MKWTEDRSGNVEDRRGMGGGGGGVLGGGLITLIIAAVIFFLGGDPSAILSSGMNNGIQPTEQLDRQSDRELSERHRFLGDRTGVQHHGTERVPGGQPRSLADRA